MLKRDLAIAAAFLCLLLMAHVFEYASVARLGYEQARTRVGIRRLEQENSNLRAQMEILQRPQRVDHLARARGMVQRNDADFIALAPLPAQAEPKTRPMVAGFLPDWVHGLFDGKR